MAEQLFPVEDNFPDFQWNPESGVCPPDRLSLWHTQDLAAAIRLRRYVNQDTEEPIRVAIAGDTGLYAIGIIQKLLAAEDPYAEGPIQLEVFDKDPRAVEAAERNIQAYGTYMVGFSADVHQADWNEEGIWQYLQSNPVHFLITNPPYLPSAQMQALRAQYSATNPDALDGGTDGLDHIRTILQHAPDILVSDGPAGVFLRYSYHSDRIEINRIVDQGFAGGAVDFVTSFRTREAVGPSSLGQDGLNAIARGDDRILATTEIKVRPSLDAANTPPSAYAMELSLRHAAVLGGMILSAEQCDEVTYLRQEAGTSFAEEEILLSGLHYLFTKMGHRYSSLRHLYDLPPWENRRLTTSLGHTRLSTFKRMITDRYLAQCKQSM